MGICFSVMMRLLVTNDRMGAITVHVFQIWDTAGQERFKSLRTPFYRGSDMCLLTFAVDDVPSFKNLETWRKEFVYYADVKADFPFLVVGNKVSDSQKTSCDICAC